MTEKSLSRNILKLFLNFVLIRSKAVFDSVILDPDAKSDFILHHYLVARIK